jgi:hypothetical protein
MKKLKLGNIGREGCPCGEYKCSKYTIDTHCWRSSCDECEFSGVHYSNELALEHAKEIQEYISESWRTETNITNKERYASI